ncbi:enoyl-CoA hydratase [Pelobium manganitolerans]|uniref:Enoyl-CoA hydratase n=1 Tax=Pelobium manganitolerans TaxID=1842495 RepID=A0A419SBH3_9SPHI|nr:enoyl-CoA hydratase/isomerase family protein [Pelobium manganitolerans]RKD20137.1 enoyl-CoA hydratase [Pelobium manganitolerans]
MEFIKTTIQDHVAIVSLDRGKSNAINETMLDELQKMVKSVEQDANIFGLILTGKHGFFTAGLDLIELYNYNEEQMLSFWTKFLKLINTLVEFKKPFITAISGHSPAGGCVLAICADYRVMAEGEYIIGLNEVPVGIIVPDSIFELYAFWIGEAKAYRNLLEGKLMNPAEAKQIGLVDATSSIDSLMTVALKQMKVYLQLEQNTWQQSKQNLRKKLIAKVNENQQETVEKVLQQWWSASTRAILKTIIGNLKG